MRRLVTVCVLALTPTACSGAGSTGETSAEGAGEAIAPASTPAPASAPVDSQPEGPPPLPEPTPEATPVEKGETFASPDGAVTVSRPPSDRYQCVEQRAETPVATTLVKCRRTGEGAFFFMMAKTYEAPRDDLKSARALAEEVFPTTYQQLFVEYEVTDSGPKTWRTRKGFESEISATHDKLGQIAKRELVVTEGTHVFILSAEGTPEVFEAESEAIDRWFETTQFAELGPTP